MRNLYAFLLTACILPQECISFFHRAAVNRKATIGSLKTDVDSMFALENLQTHSPSLQNQNVINEAIGIRGGACSDSTPALFGKVASSAAVEAFLMYQLLAFGAKLNSSKSPSKRVLQVMSALLVVFGSSYFGQLIDNGMSAATRQVLAPNEIPGDADWYLHLKKPRWNPPGWVFPIMWLIVSKPTQFVAIWKLMTAGSEKDLVLPFIVYCAHLSLGDAWNKVFFGLQCIGRGVAVISTFWSTLLFSAYQFYSVDPTAGIFLLPTCAWVTVAAALNWSIYFLNKGTGT
ncbi:hypothetical protein ACHAWO_004158 [Cyclotella atomus]|uniref:Uncharacterized protein n=1 Tax=Cyclotella atomus TaxID=382360 RepID=A0ABD3NM89_9STRA